MLSLLFIFIEAKSRELKTATDESVSLDAERLALVTQIDEITSNNDGYVEKINWLTDELVNVTARQVIYKHWPIRKLL